MDESENYVIGAETLENDFYVDDVMSGADTLEEVIEKQKQLGTLLRTAGFVLRKWSSNNIEVLQNVPKEHLETKSELHIKIENTVKTLGVHWHPKADFFSYNVELNDSMKIPTNRIILTEVAKLFDPLGWLAPVIITAKILLQNLWLTELN